MLWKVTDSQYRTDPSYKQSSQVVTLSFLNSLKLYLRGKCMYSNVS